MIKTRKISVRTGPPDAQGRALAAASLAWAERESARMSPADRKSVGWELDLTEFVACVYEKRAAAWPGTPEELAAFKSELQEWLHTHPDPALSELAELSILLGEDVFCTPLTAGNDKSA